MALQLFLFDLRGSADMLLREATVASEEQTSEEINQVSGAAPPAADSVAVQLCWSADRRQIAACDDAGVVSVFNAESLSRTAGLQRHSNVSRGS